MATLPLFTERATARPLRPHQVSALTALKTLFLAGNRRTVVQLPTGAGKTRLAAEIVAGALGKGNTVAFTVPAISLVDQTVEAFGLEGIANVGVMQGNHELRNMAMPVQVCSVQTLAQRGCPDVDVVIVDECHQQFEVVKTWMGKRPNVTFIGLSATPWARGMGDTWQNLITPVRMQELIGQGFLAPFRVFAPSHPDLTGVKTMAGDYHEGQLADVMGDSVIVADVVRTWIQRANWQPTLVFAVNRAHAAQLQREFAASGVPMGYCDAFVDRIERKVLFDQMASGAIAGIVNVGTLTTGVDADVRCVVLARPTKSEMLFVQMIGRALRTAPGKVEALILDHADNHARLGFVTDIHHDRLLCGQEKRGTRKDQGEPMPKECKSCGTLKPPKVRECPSCGFTPTSVAEIEAEEGELVEIKKGKAKPTMFDKQLFWSMANYVDRERGKGGKLAKALYRSKYGVWPKSLSNDSVLPSPEFLSYERSRRIAYAKSKGARP